MLEEAGLHQTKGTSQQQDTGFRRQNSKMALRPHSWQSHLHDPRAREQDGCTLG